MIVTFAVVVAFIGADKIRNGGFNKKNVGEIEGINIESAGKVKSIEEFMLARQSVDTSSIPEEFIPNTVSDFVFSSLIGNYEQLKANAQATPENVDQLTTLLAQQTEQFTTIPNKYSMFNVRTFSDTDKNAVKNYGNEFALIVEEYYNRFPTIKEQDSLKYIARFAGTYAEYAEALSKIRIPRGALNQHLEFINNLHKINLAILKLAEIEDDPVLSFLVLTQYNQIRESQPQILLKISKYLELNDIIFSDDEPGLMWSNY